MNKLAKLLQNVGLLTLSNFGSKVLVFLLVPLYTSVLTTEQYGTYDLLYSSVQLLFPLLTLNIVDAVTRFSLDGGSGRAGVLKVGGTFLFVSFVLVLTGLVGTVGLKSTQLVDGYRVDVLLLYLSFGAYQLMTQFARGVDRVFEFAVAGVLNTASMLILNIVFLTKLDLGLHGFFLANSISMALPTIYLVVRLRSYIFTREKYGTELTKNMVAYSAPLLFTTLGWWIINLSNRFVVTGFCGLAENGLYSVASKIPAILNVIQVVIVQAWLISAVKEFDKSDSDGFFENTYKCINTMMVLTCSVLITLTPAIARILFADEFYGAWIYVPFSLIFIVFNTMSGVWGGIFSSVKDTRSIAVTSVVSSIINVVLSIILVRAIGAQGAAIASMVSGFVIWIMRAHYVKMHIDSDFDNRRSLVMYGMLILQASLMINTGPTVLGEALSMIVLMALIAVNQNTIKKIHRKTLNLLVRR